MSDCPSPAPAPLNNAEKKHSHSLAQGPFWSEGLWDSKALTSYPPGWPPRALRAALAFPSTCFWEGNGSSYSALKTDLSMPPLPFTFCSPQCFTENLPLDYQICVFSALKTCSLHFHAEQQLQLVWIRSSYYRSEGWPGIKTSIYFWNRSSSTIPIFTVAFSKHSELWGHESAKWGCAFSYIQEKLREIKMQNVPKY